MMYHSVCLCGEKALETHLNCMATSKAAASKIFFTLSVYIRSFSSFSLALLLIPQCISYRFCHKPQSINPCEICVCCLSPAIGQTSKKSKCSRTDVINN